MPPTRTASGIASTSKAQKLKSASAPKATAAPSASQDANSLLPDLDLPASFSRTQAQKAVNALLAYAKKAAAEKEETELLAKEEHVWLNIGLKSGAVKKKVSPVKVDLITLNNSQLPHPALPPPPATSICLLTKDPQREYKDLLEAQGVKFVSRVVGVEKLKGKFKPFEARRQLMKDHDMFLCDERVVGLMPGLLGKIFYGSKKRSAQRLLIKRLPIPVNLRKKDLKTELANAVNCTYFIPTTGTSLAVRIATPSTSTPDQTLLNLLSAIPPVVAAVNGNWENVLSIGIKTSSSVLLPVWSASLSGRFDAHTKVEPKEKKEKRKSVFQEYEEEEKAEAERAKKFLMDNGEEVPEELEKMAKGLKKSKQAVQAQEIDDDEDEEEEDSDEEDSDEDMDGDDQVEDDEDDDQEEDEQEIPAPVKAAPPTPAKKKSSSAPVKPVGKKSSSIAGAASKKAKQAIVGTGGGKKRK